MEKTQQEESLLSIPGSLDDINLEAWLASLAQKSTELEELRKNLSTLTLTPFETPRVLLAEYPDACLYHYPGNDQGKPLLVLYAWFNRANILDLSPKHSFIHALLSQGVNVFLLEWKDPSPRSDRQLLHCLENNIAPALDLLREPKERLDVLGMCQGGLFALWSALLFPEKIARLVTLVTPLNTSHPEDQLATWLRTLDLSALLVAGENISGTWITQQFLALQAEHHFGKKYFNLLPKRGDQEALTFFSRLEQWIHDCPDIPAPAFCDFVKRCYQDNEWMSGRLSLGGKTFQTADLRVPLLNIYAMKDHLVPPASAKALGTQSRSTSYEEIACDTGHVGLVVSERSLGVLPASIASWLSLEAS